MDLITEEKCLCELRDEMKKNNNCTTTFDDKFLLKFLRVNDYRVKESMEHINRYMSIRDSNSDLFQFSSELKLVFESGALTILENRGPNEELILISRPGRMDASKYSFRNLMQATCVAFEVEMEDERTQRNGIINIVDYKGYGLRQMVFSRPMQAKLFANLIDGVLPVKYKSIHLVNESRLASVAFNLVKSFLGENLRTKLHFHGNRFEQIEKFVEKSVLPVEIGGENRALNGFEYFNKIDSYVNRVE